MLSKLLENPVLGIATTFTALLTILNNLIGSFGLPPFWSDLLATALIAYTTIHWAIFILGKVKRTERILSLNGTTEERIPFRALWKDVGPSIAVVPILILLLIWNAKPLFNHIGDTKWILCGSFIGSCNQRPCLILNDSRGRRISDECFMIDDDSGYKYLAAPNRWTYKPHKAVLRCDGNTSEATELNQSFFNNSCEGVMDAR